MTEDAFAAPNPRAQTRTRPRQHSRLVGLGAFLLLVSLLGFVAGVSLLLQVADSPGSIDSLPQLRVMRVVAIAGTLAGVAALVAGTRNVWFATVALGVIVHTIGENANWVAQNAYDTDVVYIALLL